MKTNNFKGRSKKSCPKCQMSGTALRNRGIRFNMHQGQLYYQPHFLELWGIKK